MSDPKVWVAISFLIFIALVGRIGWRIAVRALDARAERVRNELAEAARLRAEAEEMLRQAEAERAAALAEAEEMIARAEAEAARDGGRTAAEVEAQARAREKDGAMDRIAAAEGCGKGRGGRRRGRDRQPPPPPPPCARCWIRATEAAPHRPRRRRSGRAAVPLFGRSLRTWAAGAQAAPLASAPPAARGGRGHP